MNSSTAQQAIDPKISSLNSLLRPIRRRRHNADGFVSA